MKLNVKLVVLSILFCCIASPLLAFAEINVPFKGELPVVITNPGQSPEMSIVELLGRRNKIEMDKESFLTADQLVKYKTMIIIVGGSNKGLGSAGVNLDAEIQRAKELLATAKEKGIKVVGMHLGGKDRRGESSMIMINLVVPQCDYIVVRSDGNEDGYFTDLCKANNVPLTLIDQTNDVAAVVTALFAPEPEEVETPEVAPAAPQS